MRSVNLTDVVFTTSFVHTAGENTLKKTGISFQNRYNEYLKV